MAWVRWVRVFVISEQGPFRSRHQVYNNNHMWPTNARLFGQIERPETLRVVQLVQ